MTSRPVWTSTADGHRNAKEIDALRHVVPRKSRRGKADKRHLTVAAELGLFCPAHPNQRFTSELDGFKHVAGCLWRAIQQITGGDQQAIRAMQKLPRAATLPADMLTDLIAWRERLTDDECRSARTNAARLRRKGLPVPDDVRLAAAECKRRGLRFSPEETRRRQREAGAKLGPAARDGDPAERERLIPPVEKRRELRLALGLSQAQLAKKVGTVQGAIGAWERGDNLPKLPLAERYAKALEWKAAS